MIVNTKLTIAYKCSVCGRFEFFVVSLFDLFSKNEHDFSCQCNHSSIKLIKENSNQNFKISVPCIACGCSHSVSVKRGDLLNKEISIICCPETGIYQCLIGKDKSVRCTIDIFQKELDDLISMFGYEKYFKNTQVMFDTLNIIHDIAEKGELMCECGNTEIDMLLLSDKIYLKCRKCPANTSLKASSNEDLRENLLKKHITLISGIHSYDTVK